jgi:acetoacetyl-CoA synthetase
LLIHARDGVLNPGGVRFGSSEIYAVVENFPTIADSICVGQKRECDLDERVILFVKMKQGLHFSEELKTALKTAIKETLSSRHVPRFIFEIPDIPYTVNGKKCEINVKQIVCRRPTTVSATVANPAALKMFTRFQDLPRDNFSQKAKSTL